MSDVPREPAGNRDVEACAHPWLRVVCGECGEPVDPLVLGQSAPGEGGVPGAAGTPERAVFIVARGHPELVEQLQAAMGGSGDVQIIEDRRRTPREPVSPEEAASIVRTEFRKRIREEGADDI